MSKRTEGMNIFGETRDEVIVRLQKALAQAEAMNDLAYHNGAHAALTALLGGMSTDDFLATLTERSKESRAALAKAMGA